MSSPQSGTPVRPAPTGGGRAVGLIVAWLVYLLGVGLLGFPVFIFVFGAPVNAPLALLMAFIADIVLAAVLVGAILATRRGRPGYAVGGWVMLGTVVVLVAGFVAAYALIARFTV